MSDNTTEIVVDEVPKRGAGLLLAVAAAFVSPFDCVLVGMIRAGIGIEAICALLGLTREILDYNVVRLDLPIPHDRPRRKRGGRYAWSDEEVRCAIVWRCAGIHPYSIGRAFGRSAGAVRSKLRGLGVPTPSRKILHKVDPANLSRVPPDLGFPVPAGGSAVGPTQHTVVAPKYAASESEPVTSPPTQANFRFTSENAPPPSEPQPEFDATVDDPSEPASSIVSDKNNAELVAIPSALDALSESVAVNPDQNASQETLRPICKAANAPTPLVGPAELVEQYRCDRVRNAETSEDFVRWISLLHAGGMHYKAIAEYTGVSAKGVQGIMNRIHLPRDKDKSKFSWSCDLECGEATLKQWGYVLQRCTNNFALAEDKRPLFWRKKKETYDRKRRYARLQNKELGEYEKYKGTQYTSIVTRAELDKRKQAEAEDSSVPAVGQPARLHASMQLSLPIQRGGSNEQYTVRGQPQAVRPGFSGDSGHAMPGFHARNGGVARSVAHT